MFILKWAFSTLISHVNLTPLICARKLGWCWPRSMYCDMYGQMSWGFSPLPPCNLVPDLIYVNMYWWFTEKWREIALRGKHGVEWNCFLELHLSRRCLPFLYYFFLSCNCSSVTISMLISTLWMLFMLCIETLFSSLLFSCFMLRDRQFPNVGNNFVIHFEALGSVECV